MSKKEKMKQEELKKVAGGDYGPNEPRGEMFACRECGRVYTKPEPERFTGKVRDTEGLCYQCYFKKYGKFVPEGRDLLDGLTGE